MQKRYKHLFFDLDRTLWDFDKNSEQTLFEIYEKWFLAENCSVDFNVFLQKYREINHSLWEEYRQGTIQKEFLNVERFRKTLEIIQCDNDDNAAIIAEYYVEQSPAKTLLFPDTLDVLAELKKNFQLHIITNGFEEIQFRKLKNSGLESFFTCVITSEMAGSKKPDAGIFEYSLRMSGAKIGESIMIGDDPDVDILGASLFGMDTIFVNFDHLKTEVKSTFEVHQLRELYSIFL